MCWSCFFFFKQKTAYEMRMSDWSSDVCSSDLDLDAAAHDDVLAAPDEAIEARQIAIAGDLEQVAGPVAPPLVERRFRHLGLAIIAEEDAGPRDTHLARPLRLLDLLTAVRIDEMGGEVARRRKGRPRSEEHTSELQSLMRISYAVF